MFSWATRKKLLADLDFRRYMKDAAGSEVPLPHWVLKHLVINEDFFNLVSERLGQSPRPREVEDAIQNYLDQKPDEKRNFFKNLMRDELSLRYLLSEIIQRYNNRFSVLSGLRSLLSKKPGPAHKRREPEPEPEPLPVPAGGNQDSPWIMNFSRANPLLNWGLSTFLGMGTVTGAVVAYKQVTAPPASAGSGVSVNSDPEEDDKEKLEQLSRLLGQLKGLVQVNIPAELKVSNSCDSGCKQPSTLTGTLTLQAPPKMPDVKLYNSFSLLPQSGEGTSKGDPNVITLKLSGIPEPKPFPSSFKLDSVPYKLDSLPASHAAFDKEALVRVWFPNSYDAAIACQLKLEAISGKKKSQLKITVQPPCKPGSPTPLTSSEFAIDVSHDSNWHFVPELGASIKIVEQRNGIIGFRKKTFDVSIQATPFANLQALTGSVAGNSNNADATGVKPGTVPSWTADPVAATTQVGPTGRE